MKSIFLISLSLCYFLYAQDISSDENEFARLYPTTLIGEEQDEKYLIIGTVIDQSSREPIAEAKISLLGTKFVATSSNDGQYRIESIPEGIYQLKAEADGYESQIMNNVFVGKERKKEHMFFNLQKSSQGPPPDFVQVEKQPQPIPGNMPAPVYPEIARRAGVEGTVWVKIWVDKKGEVRNAVVLKSDVEIFNKPSIDAAMKWKFEPAVLKGAPADVWVSIPFKFKLNTDVVSSDSLDLQPKPQKTVYPKYPESARGLHLEGEFFLDVIIDEKGNVMNAVVHRLRVTDNENNEIGNLSENDRQKISDKAYASIEEMKSEAVKSIKQWKFTPGKKGGKAVKAKVVIPIKYSLQDKKEGKKK